MELCQNSLFDMLHEQRLEFTAYERVQIANDVACAMQYLHENKIIHRDIKSHNLLVAPGGIVKLCDFGLVKTKNTQAGTPAYMAPELLENASFNKSVDVYAFGILLWELFTGEVPFAGYEIPDIITQVTSGNRLRVPTVDTPVEIRRMIEDCWAQDPKARPSFPDILVVLDGLLKDMPQQSEVDLLAEDGGGDALDDILFSGK
uniref:Protein kinase domain-containing protein n=1 Tax=Florenciella parvula TaxID=236787 RepID=A0A7S2BRV6_9STRA|mmetsp:Transcript_19680/g.41345  ORF Transcript_19680/g.41345 Transcript_19680/m.41345 type:complete len:203 (+) Transcript_19680:117-725(+)